MTRLDELRRAGVDAAREARALLAELVGRIQGDVALGQRITGVVAALFTAEIGDAGKVLEALEGATQRIQAVLEEETRGDPHRVLSRAMGLLHPVRAELAQALGLRPGPPLSDRRGSTRQELEMEVRLEGDTTFFTGRSGDLSKGGLFVGTDEPLPVGTELVLSFVLPDGHAVRADAVIAWVRAPRYRDGELPAGMGVRFLALSADDERAIEGYLAQHPPFRYGD